MFLQSFKKVGATVEEDTVEMVIAASYFPEMALQSTLPLLFPLSRWNPFVLLDSPAFS